MEKISFEDLPSAIIELHKKVELIQSLITNQGNNVPNEDLWFSIEELCEYLPGKPSKATIYGYVHNRKIPHKKLGKRLAFLKSEIDQWLHSKERKTLIELQTKPKPNN